MIVVDASAVVHALVGREVDDALLTLLEGDLHAPHLLDVEVLSALRGLTLGAQLTGSAADQARQNLFALTITRYEAEPLAERVWALRHQFTAYDATYIALAEALRTPLITCDAKVATGHSAQVRVFGG